MEFVYYFDWIGNNIMMKRITNLLIIILCCISIFAVSLVIKYYSQKIIHDDISYDVKRNQISSDASIITEKDFHVNDNIKWAKRTVTFTFDSGVNEYIIGVDSNDFLKARMLR